MLLVLGLLPPDRFTAVVVDVDVEDKGEHHKDHQRHDKEWKVSRVDDVVLLLVM